MKVKQTEKHLNGGEERRRPRIKEEPRWVLCLKNTKSFIPYGLQKFLIICYARVLHILSIIGPLYRIQYLQSIKGNSRLLKKKKCLLSKRVRLKGYK